jgi:hypothetical protein
VENDRFCVSARSIAAILHDAVLEAINRAARSSMARQVILFARASQVESRGRGQIARSVAIKRGTGDRLRRVNRARDLASVDHWGLE